ncbi:hypothetical protein B0J18DRAFT_427284 [Chaetomium sp. MPI-SDFR-AT-0129]|nr:hypothetical protein B0J18DRAFT_427284 [Chaetomium sp. MPI-SDFR-AT-0129]
MPPEQPTGTPQSSLKRLRVVKEGSQNVCLILIPGVGTLQSDAWPICSATPWAEFLGELEQGVTLFGYEHSIPYDDQFTWQHVLEEGPSLLKALQAFVAELGAPQPLLFICHGLGGAILKQAICVANMHYDRYSHLLVSISGVVFLGTPHLLEGVGNRAFGDRLVGIMKLEDAAGSLSNKCLARLKESSSMLADLAGRFNRTNLRVDILSVFEQKVTKIRQPAALRRSKTKNIIIVDESLCAIATRTEQCLGVDLDHLQLPSMSEPDGKPIGQFRTWLSSVIKSAPNNLESHLSRVHRPNSASSGFSIGSLRIEEVRQALARQPPAAVTSPQSGPQTSAYVNPASSSRQDMQSLLDNFSIKQADPRIPCFMMETLVRNKNFFGRKDVLTHLDESLLPSGDLLVSSQPERIRVALLCGMGGLGKTETVIEYAYSRRDRFDAIFLIRAEDTSKLETDLAQIAVRLGIQDPNEPDDKAINRGLALEWLCNPFKMDYESGDAVRLPASWLVIFDNADEPDILAPYRDITASGAVLITSRSPLAKNSFSPQTREIEIQSFDTEEAGDFVQSITGTVGHLDEARQIGARLGGLPLALAQMAGIIRLEFLSYTEFLELYSDADEEAEVHGTVLQPLRASARGSLSTVWALEKLSASARAVLEISSFLDPDCIQESVLTHEVIAAIDYPIIPEFPTKRGAFFAARKQLIGSSLIRHNKELAEYWVHRVTQDVVRAKMEPARRKHVFANAVALVSATWPTTAVGGHDVTLWELSEKLYQHVTSLSDMYLRYLEPGDDGLDMAFATLLNRAGWYQHERGETRVQLPVLELALELCQGITSIDTRDLESDIRYALGAVANETNDAVSCRLHTERFFEIRLEVAAETGVVDERLARSYNQMGIVWAMAGEYKKAEESFATSAREYEKIPGYTKDKRSLALVNLGLAYWLQGDWDHASEFLNLGLADREELYGYMDSHSFRCVRVRIWAYLTSLSNCGYSGNEAGSRKENDADLSIEPGGFSMRLGTCSSHREGFRRARTCTAGP